METIGTTENQTAPEMPTKREKRANEYREYSHAAAKAERMARQSENRTYYAVAEKAWRQSVIYARNTKNKEYGLKRAEFCHRQYHRPFSEAGE